MRHFNGNDIDVILVIAIAVMIYAPLYWYEYRK